MVKKAFAKVMLVKVTRGIGGPHSEMGSYRHNPVTKKREFSAWIGLGAFGKSVKESKTLLLVNTKTGSTVYPDQLQQGKMNGLPVIISTTGKRVDPYSFSDPISLAKIKKLGLRFEIKRGTSR